MKNGRKLEIIVSIDDLCDLIMWKYVCVCVSNVRIFVSHSPWKSHINSIEIYSHLSFIAIFKQNKTSSFTNGLKYKYIGFSKMVTYVSACVRVCLCIFLGIERQFFFRCRYGCTLRIHESVSVCVPHLFTYKL